MLLNESHDSIRESPRKSQQMGGTATATVRFRWWCCMKSTTTMMMTTMTIRRPCFGTLSNEHEQMLVCEKTK